MGNAIKKLVKSARKKKMVTNSAPEEETFDFPALPYVCQKRFAEIMDPKTLKTFSKINTTTRNLSKRCHIVEYADVKIDEELSKCKYTLSCFCKETEFCRGIHEADLSSLKKKIDVHILIKITSFKNENVKIDPRFLRSLPFNFDRAQFLVLSIRSIKLDDLKMIMHPGLFYFGCNAGIESQCSMKEFMDFIKYLTQFVNFMFCLIHPFSSLSFNIDDLASEGAELLSQKVITKFETDRVFTIFTKYPESL